VNSHRHHGKRLKRVESGSGSGGGEGEDPSQRRELNNPPIPLEIPSGGPPPKGQPGNTFARERQRARHLIIIPDEIIIRRKIGITASNFSNFVQIPTRARLRRISTSRPRNRVRGNRPFVCIGRLIARVLAYRYQKAASA